MWVLGYVLAASQIVLISVVSIRVGVEMPILGISIVLMGIGLFNLVDYITDRRMVFGPSAYIGPGEKVELRRIFGLILALATAGLGLYVALCEF